MTQHSRLVAWIADSRSASYPEAKDDVLNLFEQLQAAHQQLTAGRASEAELRQEWLDLKEQYQVAHDALALVVAYDDAVIEWDSMKAHDPATAKAKREVSDRANELNKQAFAAARAALYPASEPARVFSTWTDPDPLASSQDTRDS